MEQRFVVRADEKLTAFVELEPAIRCDSKLWVGSDVAYSHGRSDAVCFC